MSQSEMAKEMNHSHTEKTVVIRDITPSITTISIPFLLFNRVKTGGRGTIVRLESGSLAIFSPTPLTPAVLKKVHSLGTLKYIIALNLEHHLFISSWAKEFPAAEVICMEGLPEKREKDEATRGVKFSEVLSAGDNSTKISPEFDAEFEYEYIHAHQNKEVVFLHKQSGTLIEADLIWNLPATEQYSKSTEKANSGVLTMLALKLLHTRGGIIWQKRILWYVAGAKDREGFAGSVRRIHGWKFDRIIPCHGDVVEVGGKAIFDRVTEWFREGKQ